MIVDDHVGCGRFAVYLENSTCYHKLLSLFGPAGACILGFNIRGHAKIHQFAIAFFTLASNAWRSGCGIRSCDLSLTAA